MGTFFNRIWWCGELFFRLNGSRNRIRISKAVGIRVVFTGAIALSQKGCHIKVHSDFKTEDRKAGKCPLEHPDTPCTNSKSSAIRTWFDLGFA